jgi:alkanesulfonate monooxygenase SsuD/methylene tetrahydromethanopterin reductase-like flavin-dependent oxidoreductase (luciferase family)
MTQMAGEIADGVFVHPFNTEKSLSALTLPNLQRGAEKSGRSHVCKISVQIITATALNDASMQGALLAARSQIAFYAATPAYRPVLDLHGWGDLQPELAGMVRDGRWNELGARITDEMLETFAVIGSPHQVAQMIVKRFAGRVDRVSPVIYKPDMELLIAISKAMRAAQDIHR